MILKIASEEIELVGSTKSKDVCRAVLGNAMDEMIWGRDPRELARRLFRVAFDELGADDVGVMGLEQKARDDAAFDVFTGKRVTNNDRD